ncbi:MAG: hypothetical protein FMNOHCHN_03115 [Ignavibacteriaceae bacterium]|nr:hypothetical protein [Ignavibacteriaceae bacterium]
MQSRRSLRIESLMLYHSVKADLQEMHPEIKTKINEVYSKYRKPAPLAMRLNLRTKNHALSTKN